MRTRPLPRNFSAGELAPWLDGLTNELTQKGCRTLENFIVKKQGQVSRRPGTYFVAETKDSSKASVLVPVTIDDTNTYVLEIGDAYIRFYKNRAKVTYTGTTTIYEVTSPWSAGDVSDLRWQYIPDEKALYFAHSSYAVRKLAWTSDASWALNYAPMHPFRQIVVGTDTMRLWKTEDLTTWETIPSDMATQTTVPAIAGHRWATRDGLFLITDETNDKTYISDDGEAWWDVTEDSDTPMCAAISKNGTMAVAGGSIYVSTDGGVSWTEQTAPTSSTTGWELMAFDDSSDSFRASRSANGVGANSTNGFSWSSGPGPQVSSAAQYIMKSNNSDLWVYCGADNIRYSGSLTAAWTTALSQTGFTFPCLDYGTPGGATLWVAAGFDSSTSTTIYTSSNGITWVSAAHIASDNIYSVKWIAPKFYAFGSQQKYYWSDDAITWTTVTETKFSTASGDRIRQVLEDTYSDIERFNQTNHYPANIVSHEQRLVVGPTKANPSTLWASRSGNYASFYQGEFSDEGWSYAITGDRNVDIQWMLGGLNGIVVGTRTGEGILIGSSDEGITPGTGQFRWLSTFGSAYIQPVRVHDMIVFVQRGGEIIRGYIPQQQAYQSPELTAYADHIADGGVLSLDYQDDPQSMVYAVRADGQVLALTIDNGMRAWSRIKAASTSLSVGIIESIAIIPTTGAEDEMWLVVNRKVAAGTKRYVEYMDTMAVASFNAAHYVDCGVYATSATTFQTVGGLTHLAGENVDALINGSRWLSGLTVAGAGTITVSPYSGTAIHAGLPYTSYLQTMRGDYGSSWGDGAALNKRTTTFPAWVHDSSALAKFGPTTTLATETIAYSTSTALATEVCQINFPGQWDRDNYIWCIVADPRPLTLVAILPDSETGER